MHVLSCADSGNSIPIWMLEAKKLFVATLTDVGVILKYYTIHTIISMFGAVHLVKNFTLSSCRSAGFKKKSSQ